MESNMGKKQFYTTRTLSESKWRIVGVCYVDEMVTNKVEDMVLLLILILIIVLIGTLFVGILISNIFAKPVKKLDAGNAVIREECRKLYVSASRRNRRNCGIIQIF